MDEEKIKSRIAEAKAVQLELEESLDLLIGEDNYCYVLSIAVNGYPESIVLGDLKLVDTAVLMSIALKQQLDKLTSQQYIEYKAQIENLTKEPTTH